jgi:23S rRNA (cytidine1920-2'-O)/16S rRNA (cytidine1409-2'-O)-methyltransferase
VKERLDRLVVDRKLTDSRERAKAIIIAGSISVDGETVRTPSALVDKSADIGVHIKRGGYVSRGGIKLEKAIGIFGIAVRGTHCLDIGASTGGFTDCLLQLGAQNVVALDVGRNQLAYALRKDPRVVVVEGFNARAIDQLILETVPDIVTVDVSFISLRLVLPPLKSVIGEHTETVCLIKPQFELEKPFSGFKGVVRDKERHREILVSLHNYFSSSGYAVHNATFSPIRGPKGNIEFFMHLKTGTAASLKHSFYESLVEDGHKHFNTHGGDGDD